MGKKYRPQHFLSRSSECVSLGARSVCTTSQVPLEKVLAERISSATRQGWSQRIGGCDATMKLRASSNRCETCPAKGEPARAGSQPCADPSDGVGDAYACERAGRGTAAPKPRIFPDAERAGIYRRPQWPLREWARMGAYPAGCSTRARTKRTVQKPTLLVNSR